MTTTSAVATSLLTVNQDRIRQIQKELGILKKAVSILEAEFGVDPMESRELGYALTKGVKELRQELRSAGYKQEDGYNPFWADCRRR